MSQSMLENVAKAIFEKFQEVHPDGQQMKKWEELSDKGKNFAIQLAVAATGVILNKKKYCSKCDNVILLSLEECLK